MQMRISPPGIQFIADFEGFVDHRGLELLARDIRDAEEAVNALGLELNQHQFDASVSFVYNCGAGTLHDESAFGRALRNDLKAVPAAMGLYVHDAAGRVLAGLVRRRAAEGALFRAPVIDHPAGRLVPGERRESHRRRRYSALLARTANA
jgi:GH24 family phage-related lysozyme (muramidase)